jgi:hypothetical protein
MLEASKPSGQPVDQPGTVTPGLQRTPSPAVISVTVNPFAAAYFNASEGNCGSVPNAITAGPAPESVAATLRRRSSRKYSAEAGIAGPR